MAAGWDWDGDESLLRFRTPSDWDAAYEHGRVRRMGSAAIGLAFNCTLAEASPRIVKAMHLPDRAEQGFAFTAAGAAARLNGELTPELYEALRAEGHAGLAGDAIDDTLTFVPFRELPPWLKRRWVWTGVRDRLVGRWIRSVEAVSDACSALRRRRS
ncbi:hypothetical protein [Streptomyces sp. NPDC055189]